MNVERTQIRHKFCPNIFFLFPRSKGISKIQNLQCLILKTKQVLKVLLFIIILSYSIRKSLFSCHHQTSDKLNKKKFIFQVIIKLLQTCRTKKSSALTDQYPTICSLLRLIEKSNAEDICPLGYWSPARDHPGLFERNSFHY